MKYFFILFSNLIILHLSAQNDSLCSVLISIDSSANPIQLTTTVTGTPPFTYSWSNGKIGKSITPNGTQEHSVTITDATGCFNYDEFLYVNHDSTNHLIEGSVFASYDSAKAVVFEGMAYLYQQTGTESYELADSSIFVSNGFRSPFSFGEVAAGSYIIRAVLNPDSDGYLDFLPSYFGSTLQWENASKISIPYSGTRSHDMSLFKNRDIEGDGIISGSVIIKDNFQGSADSRNNEPLSGFTLILWEENNRHITNTVSNELGQFIFKNLPYGNYKIGLEITGYTSDLLELTLSEEHPNSEEIQFTIDNTRGLISDIISLQNNNSISIYPNPVTNLLQANFQLENRTNLRFTLQDLQGKIIFSENSLLDKGKQQFQWNMAGLASSIYLFSVQQDKEIYTIKIVKKK